MQMLNVRYPSTLPTSFIRHEFEFEFEFELEMRHENILSDLLCNEVYKYLNPTHDD